MLISQPWPSRRGPRGCDTPPPPTHTQKNCCRQIKDLLANETFVGKSFFGKTANYHSKSRDIQQRNWGVRNYSYQYTFCYLKDYHCFYLGSRFLLVDSVSFSFVDDEMCRHFVFLWLVNRLTYSTQWSGSEFLVLWSF